MNMFMNVGLVQKFSRRNWGFIFFLLKVRSVLSVSCLWQLYFCIVRVRMKEFRKSEMVLFMQVFVILLVVEIWRSGKRKRGRSVVMVMGIVFVIYYMQIYDRMVNIVVSFCVCCFCVGCLVERKMKYVSRFVRGFVVMVKFLQQLLKFVVLVMG